MRKGKGAGQWSELRSQWPVCVDTGSLVRFLEEAARSSPAQWTPRAARCGTAGDHGETCPDLLVFHFQLGNRRWREGKTQS